jgi:hypothetical protein
MTQQCLVAFTAFLMLFERFMLNTRNPDINLSIYLNNTLRFFCNNRLKQNPFALGGVAVDRVSKCTETRRDANVALSI